MAGAEGWWRLFPGLVRRVLTPSGRNNDIDDKELDSAVVEEQINAAAAAAVAAAMWPQKPHTHVGRRRRWYADESKLRAG